MVTLWPNNIVYLNLNSIFNILNEQFEPKLWKKLISASLSLSFTGTCNKACTRTYNISLFIYNEIKKRLIHNTFEFEVNRIMQGSLLSTVLIGLILNPFVFSASVTSSYWNWIATNTIC